MRWLELVQKVGKMVIVQYFHSSFKLSSHIWTKYMKENYGLFSPQNFLIIFSLLFSLPIKQQLQGKVFILSSTFSSQQ